MAKDMGLLKRMAYGVAPKWAYHRDVYRQLGRGFYTAADRGPRSANWTTVNATGEQANSASRDIVRTRSRDLERNSDIMGAEILAFERNVVGTGIVLQAKVLGSNGKEDEDLNTQIETLWREWSRPGNCEITGRFGMGEIEAMIVRRRFVDGGILILKVFDKGAFKLQLLEVDDLDGTLPMCNGNRVIGGIEVDEYRRPVAYHIQVFNAWGMRVRTERVPADRVIYLPYLTRPSQTREMTPAAASLPRIDDVNELVDAAVEKERVLAHLSVVVESDGGGGIGISALGRGGGDPVPGRNEEADPEILEQGTVTYLRPGEKVSTIAPAGTSSTVDPMVKTTQRLVGGGVGLSYESVSRDMSQVNYSSARQGLLEDQKTYRMLQRYLIDHFCDEVYGEWLDWMILSGQLQIPGYFSDRDRYLRHIWIASGWDWIDPLKEANANKQALDSCQTTLQEICASKGKDYRDVLRQRAVELELTQSLLEWHGKQEETSEEEDIEPEESSKETKASDESTAAEVASQGDSIQSISLNGAQIESLITIVQLVVTGAFPYESALAILTAAFPFDEEQAKKVLNNGKQIPTKKEDESDAE